jgi:hypothetical protein
MALSAFDDQALCPGPRDLTRVLGETGVLWRRLISHVTKTYPPITKEWNFSGAKFGWSLRLKNHDRIVLYLTPQADRFLVGVVLGQKAVTAARDRKLPGSVLALIDRAPRYAEGRGIRLTVAPGDDLAPVRHLAALKMTATVTGGGTGIRRRGGRTGGSGAS